MNTRTFKFNQFLSNQFDSIKPIAIELISILLGILIIAIAIIETPAQNQAEDEIIKIDTNLIQANFPFPKDSIAPIRVFEGDQEIKDFHLTKPTAEKLSLVVIFDFAPCSNKKECRSLYNLGTELRSNFSKLRENDKPKFITTTEFLDAKDVKRLIDYGHETAEVETFTDALQKAQFIFQEQKKVRQALLIISNRIADLRDSELPQLFAANLGYVEIISTRKGVKSGWVGWNNLGIAGLSLQDNSNVGYVFDIQLSEFVDLANSLHAISFQGETDGPKDISVKTYSKIWGEQCRNRPFVKPENKTGLNETKAQEEEPNEVLSYFDEDVRKIGLELTEDQSVKSNLLPIINKNLVSNPIYENKIKNSMKWLQVKFNWNTEFPFVVFAFDKPYVGIQEFKVIAFSTKSLEMLTEPELAGVIAHELAHIILKDESESTILEEKCDLIAYLVLPEDLKEHYFEALSKLTNEGDRHHQTNRQVKLENNLATLKSAIESFNSNITASNSIVEKRP